MEYNALFIVYYLDFDVFEEVKRENQSYKQTSI